MAKAPVPTPVNGVSKPAEDKPEVATDAQANETAVQTTDAQEGTAEAQANEPAAQEGTAEAQANEPAAPEHSAEAQVEALAEIPARILVDHLDYKCGDHALLTEAEAADCAAWADLDEGAVAYAEAEKAKRAKAKAEA